MQQAGQLAAAALSVPAHVLFGGCPALSRSGCLARWLLVGAPACLVHALRQGALACCVCAVVLLRCAKSGLSKFLGGMLGAAFSPRLMLAVGLMATSVINIAFGFTSGVFWWTALWAMNGGLQVGGCSVEVPL